MRKRLLPAVALVLAVALISMLASYRLSRDAAAPVVINGTAVPPVPTLARSQLDLGRMLYDQSCASCHGVDLQGQSDWRVPLPSGAYPAPPHDSTGHTWHHDDALLTDIVRMGGAGAQSAMPAFGAQLSNAEIAAILAYIKSTWGTQEREFQWWATVTRAGQ